MRRRGADAEGEQAGDSSSYDHAGLMENGPQWVSGLFGGALSFGLAFVPAHGNRSLLSAAAGAFLVADRPIE